MHLSEYFAFFKSIKLTKYHCYLLLLKVWKQQICRLLWCNGLRSESGSLRGFRDWCIYRGKAECLSCATTISSSSSSFYCREVIDPKASRWRSHSALAGPPHLKQNARYCLVVGFWHLVVELVSTRCSGPMLGLSSTSSFISHSPAEIHWPQARPPPHHFTSSPRATVRTSLSLTQPMRSD